MVRIVTGPLSIHKVAKTLSITLPQSVFQSNDRVFPTFSSLVLGNLAELVQTVPHIPLLYYI